MRYIPGGVNRSLAAAKARLAQYAAAHDSRGFSFWAVVERASGEVVGDAGFGVFRKTGDLELGYTFRRDRWGRGYATEAARASVEYAFAELNQTRVISLIAPDNAASIRVAERLGERPVGEWEVFGTRVIIYAVGREEWGAAPR